MNFASLRHQISHFVHESREPLSKAQLRDICDMAADDKALANALFQMCAEGALTRHPAPEGSGVGVRWLYGPGKVKPGAEPQKNEGRVSSVEGKTRKRRAKHKKPRHKVQRRTAKRAARRAPKGSRKGAAPNERPLQTPPHGAMWALRSDGAFVLLGDELGLVVPRAVARSLVDFIRTLDEGRG